MVLFSATNDCLDFIKCSDLAAVLDSREIESLQSVLVTNSLNPSQIKILKKYVDEAPASKLKLSSLLKGSSFSFPKLLDHQSNSTGRPAQSDLAERRKYLQLKQEDREYNKMVYGSETNPQIESYLSRGSQFSSMQNQVAIGLNMIVSVFVIFGMTWYIAKQMKFDESTALALGMAASILIMILEMLLFIMRSIRIDEAPNGNITLNQLSIAQIKSGSLHTASIPLQKVSNLEKKFQ